MHDLGDPGLDGQLGRELIEFWRRPVGVRYPCEALLEHSLNWVGDKASHGDGMDRNLNEKVHIPDGCHGRCILVVGERGGMKAADGSGRDEVVVV